MSDPRLVGDYTIRENSDAYPAAEPTMYRLYSGIWRIETMDGAWEGGYTDVGFPDGYVSTVTTALVGEGAFDGMFAVWEARYLGDAACAWDVHGVIFPAGPPEPPAQPLPTESSPAKSLPASSVLAPSASGSLTEFKGHIVCGPPVRVETSTEAGDHQELRGGAWTPTATEMGDLRLAGEYTISTNSNVYGGAGSARYELLSRTWRIETKGGAWEASYTRVGFPDGYVSTVTTPLVGEGGYDGMFAVWEARYLGDAACAWDIRGVIFPAGPPDPPTAS